MSASKDLDVDAVIFDLDGVLIDSAAVIERHWRAWAERNGLAVSEVLRAIQGRPAREAIQALAPDLDGAAEVRRLQELEARDGGGIRAAPGAHRLLLSIPTGRWAIVTSGTMEVARARLGYAGLPTPGVLVTADDVRRGKPAPEGMLAAAAGLHVSPGRCVVLEDAPAGAAAARAAGMALIRVSPGGARSAGAGLQVSSLEQVEVELAGGALRLRVRHPA